LTQFFYDVIFDSKGTNVNISDFCERLEWNEVGTGEVRSCMIRLNAQDGQFITRSTSLAGVSTPIISQFDQLLLIVTDRNSVQRIHNFEVDILKPIQNAQQGTVLEVQMLGLENQLMKVNFSKPFFLQGGASGFDVAKDIIDFYNDGDSKGGLQPVVIGNDKDTASGGGNDLPTFTANDYHFELTEQSAYDGLITLGDRLGSSVAAGGGGDFFEIFFETDLLDVNQLEFKGFISGNPPSQQDGNGNFDPAKAITIDDTVAVNPGEEEGGIESIKGNVVGTWGADGLGTLPRQNSQFIGALEVYQITPLHVPGTNYPTDSLVQLADTSGASVDDFNQHFQANKQTTTTPPGADWDLVNFSQFLTSVGALQNYSLWTNSNATEWKSCGAKVDGTTLDDPPTPSSVSVWDSNQVVIDGTFSRTWVDTAQTSPSTVDTQALYPGRVFYRGFRVLVNGTGTGSYAGFDNKIIQYTSPGVDGVAQFVVFRDPDDDALVADDDEARVFQKQSGLWVDIADGSKTNDCYHALFDIGNDQGHTNTNNGTGGNFGEFSAVTNTFIYDVNDFGTEALFNERIFYRAGACINFRTPFPPNSHNGNTLGEFYGNNQTKFEPVTYDVTNMHFSSNGRIGFNNVDAEDLGPLDALTFFTKFLWTKQKDGTGGNTLTANYACRCFMIDTSDNVVIQDFNIPFNGLWTPVSLPVSNFKIYRARKPVSFQNLFSNIFLQELEVLQVFEYHNIQKIGLQWLGPYDDSGRYNPVDFLGVGFIPNPLDFVAGFFIDGYNIKWSIDSFQWAKAGLSISDPNTNDRAIQPRFFDEPLISNKIQLDQSNLAKFELNNFQQKRFDIVTEGLFDIDYGQSFFLKNEFLVNDADNGPNTIKLVAKRINYVIDKPPTGPGGFLRTIEGANRVEA